MGTMKTTDEQIQDFLDTVSAVCAENDAHTAAGDEDAVMDNVRFLGYHIMKLEEWGVSWERIEAAMGIGTR